jgi:PAS domain S-box-containing protein
VDVPPSYRNESAGESVTETSVAKPPGGQKPTPGAAPVAGPFPASVLCRFTDRLYRTETVDQVYDAALDAIIVALGCDRAAILLFDDDNVMRFAASRALSAEYRAAVTNHTPWKPGQAEPAPIAVDDVSLADLPGALTATIAREGIEALVFVPLVAHAGVIGKFMAYHNAPHRFTEDEIDFALLIARQLGFAIERQRAREYRASVEDARQLLSSIVENSDDAIASKDLNGIINSWNKGAERLFGYTAEEIIGKSVLVLIPLELQHEEPGIIERIRRGEPVAHYDTIRRRKNGEHVHISLTVSPVRDGFGRIVGASKIARDITERKRAEEQRNLLINELNHRVKNTLATVQSLAMQTLRNTERSEDARELFDSRLAALSRAHDLLTQQNWEGASLRDAVNRSLAPFRIEDRFSVEGCNVMLSPKQTLALSIALHELATNAAKYGALSQEGGRVNISWTLEGAEPDLRFSWIERGGPAVMPPAHRGFGSRLIERSLATELGGSAIIEYRPEGVVATIVSPLEALHHHAQ